MQNNLYYKNYIDIFKIRKKGNLPIKDEWFFLVTVPVVICGAYFVFFT